MARQAELSERAASAEQRVGTSSLRVCDRRALPQADAVEAVLLKERAAHREQNACVLPACSGPVCVKMR